MAPPNLAYTDPIIYGLIDPRKDRLFYVGKTTKLQRQARYTNHLRSGRAGELTKCARTIAGILSVALRPEMILIEDSPIDWREAETFWIEYFTWLGFVLANHTKGGDGLNGMKRSQESIEKVRQANVGKKRSLQSRELMKEAWTPERKEKHIIYCKTIRITSDELRAEQSRTRKGIPRPRHLVEKSASAIRGRKQTEQQKRKSGARIKESWTPERRVRQSLIQSERRKGQTHCKRGHPLSGANIYPNQKSRICKTCARQRDKDRHKNRRLIRDSGTRSLGLAWPAALPHEESA